MKADRFRFRAWDTVMRDWALAGLNEATGHFFVTGEKDGRFTLDSFDSEGGRFVIMQSTGLTDSEGVEIFEGDVIRFTYWWFDGNAADTQLTGTIVYSPDFMSFQLKGVKNKEWERHTGYQDDSDYMTPFSALTFDEADFGVIGNIHENPELLETK